MGDIKNIFKNYKFIRYIDERYFSGLTKETKYLIYFLISIIVLAYIIPTLIFLSPSGTDAYTHMYSTLRMADSNSLFEFYEKSFQKEELLYDYPFGLWFFGSIVMKVTGLNVNELAYILPLILLIISIFIYYIYARRLLVSTDEAIMACIFLLSIPLIAIGILNYSTSKFVIIFLIPIIYLSISKPTLTKIIIVDLLVFSLGFTHTGTYMFLMFFTISYFILSALIWKRFDRGMYILIVSLLVLYVIAVQLFPFVQPQYIDKGRMLLTISESISSKLGSETIREMGNIFYDWIFVANNQIYVLFWSCLIFAVGRVAIYIHSRMKAIDYINPAAIPFISGIRDISHGIATAPIWLGPVQIMLSIPGIFKLDQKGKCIALSLILTALFPGALQSEEGTGSLREIYYLYLIVPISSAAAFYYIISVTNKYSNNKIKRVYTTILILLLILPLLAVPIIGSLYYQPTITSTYNEKENLRWLSKIGSPTEGVPGFAYRERIDLYANKSTPGIQSGSEMKRYLNDLTKIYFYNGSEEYMKDLYSFNINYIISSERIINGFGEYNLSLNIGSNKQLDKIYSSNNNFSIYKYVAPPANIRDSNSDKAELVFEEITPEIKDLGSVYQIENKFYKAKLSTALPKIIYIGTETQNLLGEGEFYDNIRILWRGAYKEKEVEYDLNDLKYPYVSVEGNEIIYKTVVRDENNTEDWATLIVRYIFYERAIQREITVANDRVSLNDDLEMNLMLSSSIFASINDFEFNQIEYQEEKSKDKRVYPSQDVIVLKDRKFNEIYFNESGTGIFIKYSDLNPYPTRISYKGSTIYEYGDISMSSSYSLSPGGSANLVQFFSVGDKPTAMNNIEHYTSITPYPYPEAEIPVIITGYAGAQAGNSSNIYKKFQDNGITYNEVITPESNTSYQKGINLVGYVGLREREVYKSLSSQNDEVKKIKALGISGVSFRSFMYNLDTIKALSDNNILFAQAYTVMSPFMEFYREGLRYPKIAYYHGEKTGVVLMPVGSPSSSLLRPDYNVESVFSQWKETLDSVAEDGGMAVLWWNPEDIGNPDYMDKVMELIYYSMSKGMSFTTPDAVATHLKLLDKISTKATKGVDYVILNVSNYNNEEVKGITYRLQLPSLNYSCPYYSVNGRISRQEIKDGSCRIYVSFDLKSGEQKQITIDTNITRKTFKLDFSYVYEGNSKITIRDSDGAPVTGASIYVDASRFESNRKGEIEVLIRRGPHRIIAEKPGFISSDQNIMVKGRIYEIYKIPDLIKEIPMRISEEMRISGENRTISNNETIDNNT